MARVRRTVAKGRRPAPSRRRMRMGRRAGRPTIRPGSAAAASARRRGVEQLDQADEIYKVTTDREVLSARTVVIATGNQSRQVRPSWSCELSASVRQVDSSDYRN